MITKTRRSPKQLLYIINCIIMQAYIIYVYTYTCIVNKGNHDTKFMLSIRNHHYRHKVRCISSMLWHLHLHLQTIAWHNFFLKTNRIKSWTALQVIWTAPSCSHQVWEMFPSFQAVYSIDSPIFSHPFYVFLLAISQILITKNVNFPNILE